MLNFILDIAKCMDLSILLREMRVDKGYTQRQVADSIETTPSSYNRYESGEHQIKLIDFIRLIKHYGPESFRIFVNFLEKNGINVMESMNVEMAGVVREQEIKYETAMRRKEDLVRQKEACEREIQLLRSNLESKEEVLRMMRKLIPKDPD